MSNPDSGILLLDKPVGLSSNAALGRAKRILGIRKAGHTGTLDPLASGLLVLCFGEATKVAGFLLEGDKTYLAEVRLGMTTETDDAEGKVIERRPVPRLSDEDLERVLVGFRGAIEQIPPMHSALKHDGQRLYRLARRGEVVDRPARAVMIHELILLASGEDRLTLRVRCSKGTYIRSLARDLGEQLGCGAHLSALRRTRTGPFDLDDAIDLEALQALEPETARSRLQPPDTALLHLPAVRLETEDTERLLMGRRLSGLPGETLAGLVRIYGQQGFVGIGEADGCGGLKPKRLFRVALD